MDAALYFELVDAVARIDGQVELVAVTKRVTATAMHPLERRVLERAIRARSEALARQSQLPFPELFLTLEPESNPLVARG